MPLGIIYLNDKPVFEEMIGTYNEDKSPLFKRKLDKEKLKSLIGKRNGNAVRILEVNRETHDVITLKTEKPSRFSFIAGQYVMVGINKKIRGKDSIPLTIANSPDDNFLSFTIKDLGGYSRELVNSKIGDIITISKPLGESYNFDESKNLVLISGGTGITPFMSILRHVKKNNLKNNIIMINSNCKYDDIIYREELDGLSKDNIYIMNTLDKYDDSWRGEKGYITNEMILRYVNTDKLNDYTWMLCGPPGMVNSLEKTLKELGIKNVRRDKWEIPAKCER
jgi:NAD(P)H-flavin reductase